MSAEALPAGKRGGRGRRHGCKRHRRVNDDTAGHRRRRADRTGVPVASCDHESRVLTQGSDGPGAAQRSVPGRHPGATPRRCMARGHRAGSRSGRSQDPCARAALHGDRPGEAGWHAVHEHRRRLALAGRRCGEGGTLARLPPLRADRGPPQHRARAAHVPAAGPVAVHLGRHRRRDPRCRRHHPDDPHGRVRRCAAVQAGVVR